MPDAQSLLGQTISHYRIVELTDEIIQLSETGPYPVNCCEQGLSPAISFRDRWWEEDFSTTIRTGTSESACRMPFQITRLDGMPFHFSLIRIG